jgi:hypothetical protein
MSSAWGKRMSSAWGKRMSSAWGKRAESDNDEFYNQILRELYQQARINQYDSLRYPTVNEGKEEDFNYIYNLFHTLVYEQYLAQRTASNNDEDAALKNMS